MKATIAFFALLALGLAAPLAVDAGEQVTSVDKVSSNHVSLRRIEASPRSQRPIWSQSLFNSADSNSTNTTFLFNRNYIAKLSIGKEDFEVIIDTGSSDTWLITDDFLCAGDGYVFQTRFSILVLRC